MQHRRGNHRAHELAEFTCVTSVSLVDEFHTCSVIRTNVRNMSSHPVGAALDLTEEGYAMLATEPFDTQGHPELLTVQSRLEAVAWKQPAMSGQEFR